MIAQLRSELLKQRTTRTVGLLLLAATGLTLLGVFVEGISSTLAELAQEDQQLTLGGSRHVILLDRHRAAQDGRDFRH